MLHFVPPATTDRVLWAGGCWLVLAASWAAACIWVDDDAGEVFSRPTRWPLAFVAAGALLPVLFLAYGLSSQWAFATVFLIELAAYLRDRDQHVPSPERILTVRSAATMLLAAAARAKLEPTARNWLARFGLDDVDSGPSSNIRFRRKNGGTDDDDDASPRAMRHARALFAKAIEINAAEVRLSIKPDGATVVRYRVDGCLRHESRLSAHAGPAVVSALTALADLRDNRAARDHPQAGVFRVLFNGRTIEVLATMTPTHRGEKLLMRLRDFDGVIARQRFEGIGIDPAVAGMIRRIIEQPNGMLIVCGPAGAGKTVTAYTAINEMIALSRSVATVEDSIEYRLPDADQVEVDAATNLTYPRLLHSLLRRSPDVVLVGEIRDKETAESALQATLTGHFVFSTVRAHDSAATLERLLQLGITTKLLQTALSAVLAQRLIRVLCERCKEPYRAPPRFHARMKIPMEDEVVIYRKKGCHACHGTGYRGRRVITELLIVDGAIRNLMHVKPSRRDIRSAARQAGMQTLRESALEQVRRGVTSIEEVVRVTE